MESIESGSVFTDHTEDSVQSVRIDAIHDSTDTVELSEGPVDASSDLTGIDEVDGYSVRRRTDSLERIEWLVETGDLR